MHVRYIIGFFLKKIVEVFYFWFVYLFCQLRVSSCPNSPFGTQFCGVIVKIATFVFFSGILPSPLFAFIGYLRYLYCFLY